MLVKLTSKNRLALPQEILLAYPGVEYFSVTDDNGRIVLAPVPFDDADTVRSKLADLGITDQDIADAVSWSRLEPR